MTLFSDLRVSHKISALMVGLIVGFIIIGITYYIQISIDKNTRAQEQQALSYQGQLSDLATEQMRLHNVANQYMANPRRGLVADFTAQADVLQQQLDALSAAEGTAQLAGADLDSIQTQLNEYAAEFQAMTALSAQAGMEAEEGTLNELTTVANQLAERLAASGETALLMEHYQLQQQLREQQSRAMTDTGATASSLQDTFAEWRSSVEAADFAAADRSAISQQLDRYQTLMDQFAGTLGSIISAQANLQRLEANSREAFDSALSNATAATAALVTQGAEQKQVLDALVTAIIFTVAIGTAVGIYLIYKSIVFPMVHMQSIIRKINRGKTSARVKVLAHDELGDLGQAFNKLLDERIQQLEEQSKENEKLNNSIISLIRALGAIAQKDLTIKVPVSADVTGTISDAVNLLTQETAKTLHQVRDISEEVNGVSSELEEQSEVVGRFAENERRQIVATSKALEVLANAMNDIAQRSEAADKAGNQAIDSTRTARETVVQTVSGIRTIRETLSETEKRVKRLGERSQEVSGIVNLINTIAERTHILALNASMHAASAGEAGKGFAVVADEVQRLAENARQSTDEISAMVNSMRVDTSDTVNIMNTLITQVADGTRLAEQAGQQMQSTEAATQDLVQNVKVIAGHAVQQAEVANRVKERSAIIRSFSEKTAKQLEEQRKQTQGLKHCASTLVERVSVFKLPEYQRQPDSKDWGTGELSNVRPLPPAAEVS